MSNSTKHIHTRLTKSLFDEFTIVCLRRGVKKQQVLEWFIQSVADEDPRSLEIVDEMIDSKKADPEDLTDYEIEELRKIIGN